MKKRTKNFLICTFFIFLIGIVLTNNSLVKTSVVSSFDLWLKKVFPSLFPMFIISDILIKLGFATTLAKIFTKISSKLFKVNGLASYVMIMSMLSGTPSNAIFIRDLYDNNYLSTNDASKILCFTFFPNPLFLYTFLLLIFKDITIALKIIAVCYLGNLFIGILLRNFYPEETLLIKEIKQENNNFPKVLTESIKKSMNNMLMILGTITFFILMSSLVTHVLDLTDLNSTILRGVLELTNGLNDLIVLNSNTFIKIILSGIFISFGGFSIHMQVKSVLGDTLISYKLFLLARTVHIIITTIILFLLF